MENHLPPSLLDSLFESIVYSHRKTNQSSAAGLTTAPCSPSGILASRHLLLMIVFLMTAAGLGVVPLFAAAQPLF